MIGVDLGIGSDRYRWRNFDINLEPKRINDIGLNQIIDGIDVKTTWNVDIDLETTRNNEIDPKTTRNIDIYSEQIRMNEISLKQTKIVK